MTFVVLEGFSGTGKTTLAKGLEGQGWLRLQESAHAVPEEVPVADRADTLADYSLLGATMMYTSIVSTMRGIRRIVAEGYLLSDLAYARVRFDLKKSEAYPSMLAMCRDILANPRARPDIYILLKANPDTIDTRQKDKNERERNLNEFFRTRYYSALSEIHQELGESRVERVYTDTDMSVALGSIVSILKEKGLID